MEPFICFFQMSTGFVPEGFEEKTLRLGPTLFYSLGIE